MKYAKLEGEIRLLKAYASGCTILALASLLGTALQAQNENERFTEIEVERINVVQADGRLALVIANSQRLRWRQSQAPLCTSCLRRLRSMSAQLLDIESV